MKFEQWWKENRHLFEITSNKTWLHPIARTIHNLAKITAFIPDFKKKYKKQAPKLDENKLQKLKAKFELYQKLSKEHQNEQTFFNHELCDATLTTGLMSANPHFNIKLEHARDKQGFWKRRQVNTPCYPKSSGSTISRDMMIGIYWYLHESKNLKIAEETYKHAKDNHFVLGLGDPARLIMMPPGEATLASIIHKLGGKNHFFARHQSKPWPLNMKSFHVHLLMMNGLLHGRIHNKIPTSLFKAFEHYSQAPDNHNPLHQYAYHIYKDGDMNKAVDLLLNEQYWPNDRLPRRKDRENDWITGRDFHEGNDWKPATEGDLEKEHNGGDFLVVAYLILEEIKTSTKSR